MSSATFHTFSPQNTGLFGAGWILVAGCLGVLGNVTSVWAGALVLTIGVTPPLVMVGLRTAALRANSHRHRSDGPASGSPVASGGDLIDCQAVDAYPRP